MPDKIKRKALEEQERKRQPEKLAELAKAIKTQIPERKIEWVDPPLHDPNRKPEMIPLPNYTGVKAKMVPLPDDPNEPIRMQKMPYLIDTKPKEDAQTGGMIKKPSAVSRYEAMEQKAREYAEPALFDAVSPFGKGLAKIIAISGQKPDEAGQLFKFMQTSEKDPESPYYRPYARPTNKVAMDELLKLGIDTSNLDEKWFNDNAWLMQYARLGSTGMPKVPTSNSSREETAAYYYVRLADSEGRTLKAETELSGLRREIGYWAGRQDRNYSDEEIISRIGWNKYPTLTMLREGQQKGRPVPLNRAIDFDSDTVYGMLWSARNGKTSGSSTIDAARYVLGEGKQFAPDEFVRAKRDLQSFAYNPYALGSTVDEAAEYFKVDSFDQKWLNDNKGILKSGNETAMKAYSQVYGAEQVTKAAEDETRKLSERIDARLNRAVSAGGNINANALLKDALFGLDTLQSMDEGLVSGNFAKLTRPVNYRWQDVASKVSGQVQVINARQNAPHNPAELELAARNEEEKVIQGQGTLIQKDAAPKSYTSLQEKMPGLWAAGLTKNPLSAGWYAPAGGEQSGFGPDQAQTQAIADLRKAGNFIGAAAQGYDSLTGFGGDLSKLSTNEGAVRMAIDLALDSARAFSVEQTAIPILQVTAARFDDAVNSILGIDPDAVAKILPQILFTTTVQGDIKNQASGTAGLVSAILRLGEGALKTVTDHVLGQAPTLQTVQNMFHILRLRDMEKGTKSEASQAAEAALKKTAGKTLQTAAAQTGHEELDDLTGIANQSSHNLDAILNRWGVQGVNYIGNLLKAGRGDLAAAITAMPTYAKSAIVAETNMRTFGLNDAAIAAQENALKVDMKSPIVVFSAKQIAKQQAVEARKAELTTGGGLNVQSILVQKVNEAGKAVNNSKLALNQAVRNEQTGRDALTKAQALFHKNMADTAAADTVVAAIDNLQKATDARAKAQETHKQNQQSLNDAQQKLTDTQKRATARLDEQAKQDVDDMRLKLQEARVKMMEMAGGQGTMLPGRTQILDMQDAAPGGSLYLNGKSLQAINNLQNGNGQPPLQSVDLFSNRPSLLAKNNGNDIIMEGSQQLEPNTATVSQGKGNRPFRALAANGTVTDVGYANGASTAGTKKVTAETTVVPSNTPAPPSTAGAGKLDWMAVSAGNNPYSHMGIQDADYQAYLDGKLTEADLLTIANAAELYQKVAGGSGNWAYIYQNLAHYLTRNIRVKYDPDYIKNDTYDYTHEDKYNSSSNEPMPGAPKHIKWTRLTTVDDQEEEKSATPGELLAAVMTPEQLAGLSANKEIVFSMLTEEQKRQVDDGKDLFSAIKELDQDKQQQIEQLAQGIYDSLSNQQKKDLIFLRSGAALGNESLDTRMAILQWKKENKKEITYEDLVKMGFYTQGEFEDVGRKWASSINLEYDLVYNENSSIAMLDQEQWLQRGMETTMLVAMAVAPAIDRALYGPSDQIFGNNRFDNLERQGTTGNFTGSKDYRPPQTGSKDLGYATGTGNSSEQETGTGNSTGQAEGTGNLGEPAAVIENSGGPVAGTEDVGKIITEIKYKPSSGVIFKANPNKTTTILGNYDRDMKNIINEMGDVKSTYFGEKKGGFNVLNVPNDKYKNADQFWNEHNLKWLDEAIARDDEFILATKPTDDVLWKIDPITRTRTLTGFGREYQRMVDSGYVFDPLTSMMVRK